MIVTCPQCATQYNLPDASVRQGAKARCAQCKTIFVLHVQMHASVQTLGQIQPQPQVQPQAQPQVQVPVQNQAQPQVQIQRQAQSSPIMSDGLPPLSAPPPQNAMSSALGLPSFMQDSGRAPQGLASQQAHMHYGHVPQTSQMGQAPQIAQVSQVPQYRQQAEQSTRPSARRSHGQTDTSYHNVQPQEIRSTPFQLFMTGLLLLAIFGMLGFGAWRFMPRLGNDQLEAEASRIAYAQEQIKDIALHNVRQYTVESAKVGLLLVIEGRAINNFRSPREMIKVEAALYDKDGKLLDSTQQLCGVLVSKLQMQIWDAKEIEAALDNELKAYERNVNVASGTSVPFMVVFMNPPASVASYGVHVVDAQASPSK